jgi:hypothetical protein
MTPTREKLLRLALAMPEPGVETITKSILWICPGLANPNLPAFVRKKVELLEELRAVATGPALLSQVTRELALLKQQPVEPRPPRDNVVPLFVTEGARP